MDTEGLLKSLKEHMENKTLTLKLKDFFKKRASEYHVDMAFLYGSRASGYPREDSDIDLAIVFSSQIQAENALFSLITDIAYQLQKIIKIEVNIIPVHRDFRKPMLYYNVIVTGIPVFIKENESFLNLRLEAVRQMEDFSIFGIPWQLEAARRTLRG